ncbi:Bromodomain adjacent to zinc finger domain protein 1A [Homalodisca vitripennis]|nr:Bromodomain adjacent to zinc finger domain protein 1A [Homalodisca vitripennis]
MTSTSLSQLFLHISTLDSSITWGRSILKASCRLCRRRGDPEKMLLCDGCNKGHHMYCLKPKLTSVPQGNWYCPKCKPREKTSPVKKSRRIFTEDSDEDEEKENDTGKNLPVGQCKVCKTKGPVIICETCDSGYHFDCIVPVLRKIPTGNWYCQKCRRGSTASTTTKKGYKRSK